MLSVYRGKGFCPEGEGSLSRGKESVRGESLSGGVSVGGGVSVWGSLSWGVSVWKVSVKGPLCPEEGLCPVKVTCGWYTSCWNTFLFACIFTDGKGRLCFQRHLSVILFTVRLMATRSLLILVTTLSVQILLECFLVRLYFYGPQGKVMFSQACVSHSVHNQPHGYSVTANPCCGAVRTHPTGMLSCL